ncbi:type II toxin-antitoxin system Phd/YefM family antitoxin [Promineifilum sp.]|uniref:type II toxin-antitoxin system Phd/YefM family antitoxin n=1 Tax=Promineifilum sp. TaxID=2664178 RepID=UPI0035B27593
MEERQIGTTELRQRLTDVLQAIKEEKVAYVVETFGRPQAVLIDLEEYRRLENQESGRTPLSEGAQAAFGMWRDREDIDDDWLNRGREQWDSAWRQAASHDE